MPTTRRVITMVAIAVAAACKGGGEGRDQATGQTVKSEDRIPAGGVLPAANALSAARPDNVNPDAGANLFASMNCDGCHGGGGLGWVGPSLVDGRWRYGGTDGALYQSIFYGRPRGMPAYGGVMSPGAIWKVVSYIRSQPVPDVVPTQSWPSREAAPRPAREQGP